MAESNENKENFENQSKENLETQGENANLKKVTLKKEYYIGDDILIEWKPFVSRKKFMRPLSKSDLTLIFKEATGFTRVSKEFRDALPAIARIILYWEFKKMFASTSLLRKTMTLAFAKRVVSHYYCKGVSILDAFPISEEETEIEI